MNNEYEIGEVCFISSSYADRYTPVKVLRVSPKRGDITVVYLHNLTGGEIVFDKHGRRKSGDRYNNEQLVKKTPELLLKITKRNKLNSFKNMVNELNERRNHFTIDDVEKLEPITQAIQEFLVANETNEAAK